MPESRSTAELFAASLSAQQAEDYDRAQALLRQVLAIDPGHADALNNLGLIAYLAHCYPEAADFIRRAIARVPGRAAFHNNLGVVLSVAGQGSEAVESFGRAVAAEPANATFRCNLANAVKECGDVPAALEGFRAASVLDPGYAEAHFGAAVCLLALGRIGEAWPEHRWRALSGGLQIPAAGGALYDALRQRPLPELPGEYRGRRLLILHEQGLGDQLFFLRFAPILKARGARLVCLASEPLAPLLAGCGLFEEVASDPARAPDADQRLLMGDLPLAAAAHGATPPPLVIRPDASALAAARRRLARAGPPPYLGITWRAGNAPTEGRPEALRKSLPVAALGKAVAAWRGTIVALQRQPLPGEFEAFHQASGLPLHDCSDLNADLIVMHALLAAIEEYAGVSNTNMHLRAAAGKTARVLVAFPPEWRWLLRGDESPWFPGFQLYREGEDHDWEPALARLAADLASRKRPRSRTTGPAPREATGKGRARRR